MIKRKTVFTAFLASIGFSASAHATISLSGDVTFYKSFSETYGSGIALSDPFASEAFTSISDTKDYGGTNTQSDWLRGTTLYGAKFVGTIVAPKAGSYAFSFGGDDAGYLFMNGNSTPSDFIGDGNNFDKGGAARDIYLSLDAGANSFSLEYANEIAVQSALEFSPVQVIPTKPIPAAPETSTWLMMLAGFAGLGIAANRKTKRKDDAAFSAGEFPPAIA